MAGSPPLQMSLVGRNTGTTRVLCPRPSAVGRPHDDRAAAHVVVRAGDGDHRVVGAVRDRLLVLRQRRIAVVVHLDVVQRCRGRRRKGDGTRVPRLGLHDGRVQAEPDAVGDAAGEVLDVLDPQGRGRGRDPGGGGRRDAYGGRDRYRRDQQTGSLHGVSFPLGPAGISPRWHQLCSDTPILRTPTALRRHAPGVRDVLRRTGLRASGQCHAGRVRPNTGRATLRRVRARA